jgi:hypothetical protein
MLFPYHCAAIAAQRTRDHQFTAGSYWMELATLENTLFELEPIRRIVPTTMTKITASITAYSAMS